MRFSINQNELSNALSIVSKALSTRSTLPILSGIYIKAINDNVVFQATNLESSVQYTAKALVEESGEIVAPGKLLNDIIKNLPDASVQISSSSNDSMSIDCKDASFNVRALDANDFPAFPEVAVVQSVELPFTLLTSMAKKVIRVAARDDNHMIPPGVLIEIEEDIIKLVASDSYRLAIAQQKLKDSIEEPFSAIIATDFLNDVIGMNKTDDAVVLSLSENQIIITYQNVICINRRIEGKFPNYRRLIPDTYTTRVVFNRDDLTASVKRASLMGTAITPVKFTVNCQSGITNISSSAQDIGSVNESVICKAEGEPIEIAFNSAYVIDGLTASGVDELALETTSPLKPGIFKTPQTDEYIYLVMPVRIS
ncbi:MAG: DNA polymerase III subunit beta [Eggerthellaceae bacterium]|nr:DNA polymerase III subunit beta [Eggerthellaceae bacterium]